MTVGKARSISCTIEDVRAHTFQNNLTLDKMFLSTDFVTLWTPSSPLPLPQRDIIETSKTIEKSKREKRAKVSTMSIIDEFPHIVGQQPPCDYLLKRFVGKGNFATVYQMVQATTQRVVVGKFMDTSKMTEKNKAFALAEAKNAAQCSHPNIIEFIASYESPTGKLLLIFEYADAGDLSIQVNARAPGQRYFKEHEILMITAQLCLALRNVHCRNMMHRDLKADNIFLTTSGLIKLGDFGLARQYDDSVSTDVGSTFCGTPYYLAPELWNQSLYSNKADVWSLGVVMYELMALKKPFVAATMKELVSKVISGVYEPLPPFYGPETVALVQSMLSLDPVKRPTIEDVLRAPVMVSLGLSQLRRNLPRLIAVEERVREMLLNEIDQITDSEEKGKEKEIEK